MSTPQSKHPIFRLTEIAKRVVTINQITQIDGSFRMSMPVFELESGQMKVEFSEKPSAGVMSPDNKVAVFIAYRFQAFRDDEEKSPDPIITVESHFAIQYQFDDSGPLTDEELSVFAEINGNLNANPYWREYLGKSLQRAGMPNFTVQPFIALDRINKIRSRENALLKEAEAPALESDDLPTPAIEKSDSDE